MIQRALLQQLREWKDSEDRKPLILRGARQVGKSTLVEMFSKEFDIYLHLNLDEEADRMIFEKHKNIDTLINAIYVHCYCQKSDRPTNPPVYRRDSKLAVGRGYAEIFLRKGFVAIRHCGGFAFGEPYRQPHIVPRWQGSIPRPQAVFVLGVS